jgi:hypothetical protein
MDVNLEIPQSKSSYQQIQYHVLPSFKMNMVDDHA